MVRIVSLSGSAGIADEADNYVTGWLLTQGFRLYDTLFSHHFFVTFIAAQMVSYLDPTDSVATFRLIPWLGYGLASWAIARSPVFQADRPAGILAGSLYLAAIAWWSPIWLGHLLLYDHLLGSGLVIAGSLFFLPTLRGLPISRPSAFAAGISVGLAIFTSPMALGPLGALVAIVVASRKLPMRRHLRWVGEGLAAAGIFLAAWMFTFGSWAGFIAQGIDFNVEVYAKHESLVRGDSFLAVLSEVLRREHAFQWTADLPRLGGAVLDSMFPLGRGALEWLFSGLLLLCLTGTYRVARGTRAKRDRRGALRALGISLLGFAFFLALRGRGSQHPMRLNIPFLVHESGFYQCVLAGSAVIAVSSRAALAACLKRYRLPLPGVLLGALVLGWFLRGQSPLTTAVTQADEVAHFVAARTTESDRIAVYHSGSDIYLKARRLPATSTLYYYRWVRDWEKLHPERPSTCAALGAALPKIIVFNLWERAEGPDGPQCLSQLLQSQYAETEMPRVWERR